MRNMMKTGISLTLTGLVVSAAHGQIEYSPPALDFGVPDLQGTWSYETRTGLQRPAHYSELEIDKAAMLSTLSPPPRFLMTIKILALTDKMTLPMWAVMILNISALGSLLLIDGKYASIIIDPPDGRIHYREQGAAIRRRQLGRISVSRFPWPERWPRGRPLDRCLKAFSSSTPFISSVCNNNLQIIQSPDHVVLVVEMVHDAMIVKMTRPIVTCLTTNGWEILWVTMTAIPWWSPLRTSTWEVAQGYGINASMNMVLTSAFARLLTMKSVIVLPLRIRNFIPSPGRVRCQCDLFRFV